ncbi:MAG: DUF541 domain-containing protein [Candidatus Kapaibacterium sp.]|nr:MAG: DUF541 domain-containing protein [Candidatus Kapabacteria bacterium]
MHILKFPPKYFSSSIPVFMRLLSFFLIPFFAFCMESPAQTLEAKSTITVSGSAEIRVPPDEVVLSLEVQKLNKDINIAKKQNDETVAKILDLTRRFGILSQNVQTNYTQKRLLTKL